LRTVTSEMSELMNPVPSMIGMAYDQTRSNQDSAASQRARLLDHAIEHFVREEHSMHSKNSRKPTGMGAQAPPRLSSSS
jgi:hypothetical protein